MACGCDSAPTSASKPASSPPPQANKPALPIRVTFEPVKERDYLKALYKNESRDAFKAEVTRHPTLGQEEMFLLEIGPGDLKIDGEPTGMHYYSGDIVTIDEANHAPLKVKVP